MIFAGKRRAEGAYFLSSLLSPEKKTRCEKTFRRRANINHKLKSMLYAKSPHTLKHFGKRILPKYTTLTIKFYGLFFEINYGFLTEKTGFFFINRFFSAL